jgi:hypothetical protein
MLRAITDRLNGWFARPPRARRPAPAVTVESPVGSRRHLARAAGSEWRTHCAVAAQALPTLDGGLDRTVVPVWSDRRRAALPMVGTPHATR